MKRKIDLLRAMNPTLRELILAILIWGLILGAALVWLADSPGPFFAGLAVGMAVAVFMACHMYAFIENSLEMTGEDVPKYMAKGTVIRILVIILAVLAVWKLGGNVIAVFLGVMTLKIGAYTQPLLHKILKKL